MTADVFAPIQGNARQVELTRHVLEERCDYPWERLLPGLRATVGRETIPVEWVDLTRYGAAVDGRTHGDQHSAHVLAYRRQVLGLAWYSGKVSVEATLTGDLAAEVLLAETAHMVDFFALTNRQRVAVWNALHDAEHRLPEDVPVVDAVDLGHGHGWFDVGPYGSWVGEAFMEAFVKAFSDVPVVIKLGHHPTDEAAAVEVRAAVLGERLPLFGLAGSRVYHDSHRGIAHELEWAMPPAGRRPCRVCKPST